jgi:hypothetical protein
MHPQKPHQALFFMSVNDFRAVRDQCDFIAKLTGEVFVKEVMKSVIEDQGQTRSFPNAPYLHRHFEPTVDL